MNYKKIILLTFLYPGLILLFHLFSFAKQKYTDTIYLKQYNYDFLYENMYIFNQKGNLIEFQQIAYKNGNLSSGFKFINQIDQDGLLKQTFYYSYVNNKWYLFSKATYSYDVNNLLIERLSEIRTSGQWVFDKRNFYIYNKRNYLETEYIQQWLDDEWKNKNRKTFSYHKNDSLKTILSEIFSNKEWLYEFKYTFEYDNNDNLIKYQYEKWDNWKLIEYWKYEYTYYPNNFRKSRTFEKLVKESSVPISKFEYSYDNENRLIEQTEYFWKDVEWIGKEKIKSKYNANSLLVQLIYEKIWEDKWIEFKRISKKYNEFQKISESIEESFESEWTPRTKELYTYNMDGFETQWVKQEIFLDEFIDKYKVITNYDNENSLTDKVSLKFNTDNSNWDSLNTQMNYKIIQKNTDFNLYGFYLKVKYNYLNNSSVSNIKEIPLSPNPTNEFIQFIPDESQSQGFIMDMNGKLVKELIVVNHQKNTINVQDLNPGIYFLIHGKSIQKFIKQ